MGEGVGVGGWGGVGVGGWVRGGSRMIDVVACTCVINIV